MMSFLRFAKRWPSACLGGIVLAFLGCLVLACSAPACPAGQVRVDDRCVADEPIRDVGVDAGTQTDRSFAEQSVERRTDQSTQEQANTGPGTTGQPCRSQQPACGGQGKDAGFCLRDGYCSRKCERTGDCPRGMNCRDVLIRAVDGTSTRLRACVKPSTETLCKRASDCPSDRICALVLTKAGDAVERRCMPPVPKGNLPGEACDSAKNLRCRNDLCANNAFCSDFCDIDSDCPERFSCDLVEFVLSDKRKVKLKGCVPRQSTCKSDKDCATGTSCQLLVTPQKAALQCVSNNAAGAKAGEGCNPQSADPGVGGCYNNLCVDLGFCMETCEQDVDCRKGFRCNDIEVPVTGGRKVNFRGCISKNESCKRNADCEEGLVCVLGTSEKGDKLMPFCSFRRYQSQKAGFACKPASADPRDSCATNMCLGRSYCSALCVDDADCPKDTSCQDLTVELKDGKVETIKGCMLKKQTP